MALEAFCKGGTIGDAAKAASVSRQTLHRWRAKYPHFALAMSSWRSACLSIAEGQLEELASRAVGALADAIDKGDANTAKAVLRSLGVLRTYQPSKAPAAARDLLNRGAVEQEKEMIATLLASAPSAAAPEPDGARERRSTGITLPRDREQGAARKQVDPGQAGSRWSGTVEAGEPRHAGIALARGQEKEAVAKSSSATPTETERMGCQAAGVLDHQNVTSESAEEQKPAILAGKAGSAIRMACDSALQDATECYQMLPAATGQDALPPGISLAS